MAKITLASVRERIKDLQAKLNAVDKSAPPLEHLTEQLRTRLNLLIPTKELISGAATGLLTGGFHNLTPETAPVLSKHAYGLAIAAIGVDKIIEAALQEVTERDDGRLRLTPADRLEQLGHLRVALYEAELAEQELIGDEPQRPDVSGAALLRLPLGIVIEREIW